MEKNQNELNRFFGKLYDILYRNNIINKKPGTYIIKGKPVKLSKVKIVNNYLGKLGRVQREAYEKDKLDLIKKLYYELYLIKIENVSDAYWKKIEAQYLAEGHGYINLASPKTNLDSELREEHFQMIYEAQKASLDGWLNYLLSPDSNYLPMWAKVWAFQGMLKIGTLNEKKDGYLNRDNNTVNPFVDINSEILGKSVEYLENHFEKKEFDDEEIKRLVDSESFANIYGNLLAKVKAIKINGNEGIWMKYNGGSEKEAERLYNDLQGYNTGWCTAINLEIATSQLCGSKAYIGGDFYVYYSKDENNEYKIPRIAIRMDKDEIGEIRGIAKNQNIETDMEAILQEKLKEFPDGKSYMKKVSDMKKLTKIYKKYKEEELTKEELKFLYEIDDKIEGFGYQKDPRIEEIKKTRNEIEDLNQIFKDVETYSGDLYLSSLKTAESLILPKIIGGSLYLNSLKTAKGLILPESIEGELSLNSLTTVEGLILPKSIGRNLSLASLTTAEGLTLPESIEGELNLSHLTTAKGLKFPKNVGSLYLNCLKTAEGLTLTKNIGNLFLNSLTTAEGLILPENIDNLFLNSLTTAEGLILPESIGGELNLSHLTTAKGLKFPKNVGSLYLNALATAEGLILPESIGDKLGGNLHLDSLVTAKGLTLPKRIKGNLFLQSLATAEGLVLPESIGEDLYLFSLTTAKDLLLPKSIEGDVCLKKLNINDLLFVEMPTHVGEKIYLSDGEYTLEELKEAIATRREKMNLENQKEYLANFQIQRTSESENLEASPSQSGNMKHGYINLWYILIPAITLLIGILLASLIYY